MHKKFFYIKMTALAAMLFILSCKNDQQDKQVSDSTKVAATGAGVPDSGTFKKADTASMVKKEVVAAAPVKTVVNKKDSIASTIKKVKTEVKHDTSSAIKSVIAPVTKNDNTVNKNIAPAKPVDPNAPFVSKYGTIPRNATKDNITSFFTAFPDKSTVIKINFDGAADAEMTGVKTQIIKVLRSSGYTNVQDQSATIEPKRMPKEIHYELQRDGSVVLWVPVANTDQ